MAHGAEKKKLNKDQKFQLQIDRLKEQAQIDLEGYVTSRSALRATRTDLIDETKKYEHMKSDYVALQEHHAPYKVLYYKRKKLRRSKRHIKELNRAKTIFRQYTLPDNTHPGQAGKASISSWQTSQVPQEMQIYLQQAFS